jgi:NDP-sugar pyrophosphorylase family protein
MFTGIQILEPRIFEYIPRGVFSHTTTDVYPQAIARGEKIAAHVGEGIWHELSTLRRYLDISLSLLRAEGSTVYAGTGSSIEAGASVQNSILWTDVVIEDGSTVAGSVIGDGVRVRAGERWADAVVVRAELIDGAIAPAKAHKGRITGDKFVVPLSQ